MGVRDIGGQVASVFCKARRPRYSLKRARNALEQNNLSTFSEMLDLEVIGNDYRKWVPLYNMVIEEYPHRSEFLRKVVEFRANLNDNCDRFHPIPILSAARNGNYDHFVRLCEAGADINVQNSRGKTALHFVVSNYSKNTTQYRRILTYALKNPNIAVNVPNYCGKTPIERAVSLELVEVVQLLLKLAVNIDLDTYHCCWEKTIRDTILDKFEYYKIPEEFWPLERWKPRGEIVDYKHRLFYFLSNDFSDDAEDKFVRTFQEALDDGIDGYQLLHCLDYDGMTLLQESVVNRRLRLLKFLVYCGADVNYASNRTERPIYLAIQKNAISCFSYLINLDSIDLLSKSYQKTLLHAITEHFCGTKLQWFLFLKDLLDRDVIDSTEHLFGTKLQWFIHLKDLLARDVIDINAKDVEGRTALHYAVTGGDEQIIFELLDNGARLDIRDDKGKTPLHDLSTAMMKKYLDENMETNESLLHSRDLKITFAYKYLCGKGAQNVQDVTTQFLLEILKTKHHQTLLVHPAIASLIYLKWTRIRLLYYLYLFLALCFSVLYTVFIFSASCKDNSCEESYSLTMAGKSFLLIYLLIRCGFEIFDFYCDPWKYLKLTENYIQLAMISLSLICLFCDCPINPSGWTFCRSLLALSVLFVWLELFFVTGKQPKANFFLDMFRKASLFLLQFIIVHTTLILAFVFSFHALFQEEPDTFNSLPKTFFKTLIMLTGEYDVDSIPFDSSPIVSHILFILFMFLVSIVLFNLLIGLAVSATRPVEEDPYLFSNIAQIPIIVFIEKTFFIRLQAKLKIVHECFFDKRDGVLLNVYRCIEISPNYYKLMTPELCEKGKQSKKDYIKQNYYSTVACSRSRIIQDVVKMMSGSQKPKRLIECKIEDLQGEIKELQGEIKELQDKEYRIPLCSQKIPAKNAKYLLEQALEAWQKDDLSKFKTIITLELLNYDFRSGGLIYLLSAKNVCKKPFWDVKLELKPNLNKLNVYDCRRTAIQQAITRKNFGNFWILLQAGADLNNQDFLGQTILHFAVAIFATEPETYLTILDAVLKQPDIAINVPNFKGETPIALAVCQGNEEVVKLFLEHRGTEIDLDTFKSKGNQKSARDMILDRYSHLENLLPGKWKPHGNVIDYRYRLFYFMDIADNAADDMFIKTFNEAIKVDELLGVQLAQCLNGHGWTYLQLAIKLSKIRIVKFLIDIEINVNFTEFEIDRPIFMAALHHNPEYLKCLLTAKGVEIVSESNGRTLVHMLSLKSQSQEDFSQERLDVMKVLLADRQIDVNAKDSDGFTALDYALTRADDAFISILLDNGARLDERSIKNLGCETFSQYLDSKISVGSDSLPQSTYYTLFFDYACLRGNQNNEIQEYTTKLLRMIVNTKQHQKLTAHPVIACLILLKWMRIRKLYYSYLFFSLCFTLFFTAFIYLASAVHCEGKHPFEVNGHFVVTAKTLLLIYLVIRFSFEMLDFWSIRLQYLKLTENYIQLAMIILSTLSLAYDCPSHLDKLPSCRIFLPFSMLFVWLELFFVIGKHPKINFFLDMFRKASSFLFQFIIVHTALILAFVFSFYVMFINQPGPFESVPNALFKTLIMITGEFDVDSIPFHTSPFVSHLLFILFIFLVAIVFINLLIGLAVSATRPIEEDPYLYSNMAQIQIIFFIENLFSNNVLLKSIKNYCWKSQEKKEWIFAEYARIRIEPNRNMKLTRSMHSSKYVYSFTAETIVDINPRLVLDAQEILARKQLRNPDDLERKIDTLHSELNSLKQGMDDIQLALYVLIAKIK